MCSSDLVAEVMSEDENESPVILTDGQEHIHWRELSSRVTIKVCALVPCAIFVVVRHDGPLRVRAQDMRTYAKQHGYKAASTDKGELFEKLKVEREKRLTENAKMAAMEKELRQLRLENKQLRGDKMDWDYGDAASVGSRTSSKTADAQRASSRDDVRASPRPASRVAEHFDYTASVDSRTSSKSFKRAVAPPPRSAPLAAPRDVPRATSRSSRDTR